MGWGFRAVSRQSKLLIIEDDEDIRETLEVILSHEGFQVRSAPDGETGMQLLWNNEFSPDLILLDLMMPVMTGWKFLERRKVNPKIAGIPVIAMSAMVEGTDSLDCDRFLRKPIDLNVLLHQILSLLDQPSL